ncbi:amidase family protein [Ornithinimicrobium panacihumi]|uniref:amidase family protein n=1 Tax=Ornithinimicrobium panacihumi TaxID=2008449 RepID=UPI003F8AC210
MPHTLLAPEETPTALELTAALRRREISAREALDQHLARIDAVNPQVNAIVTVVADQAHARAHELDEAAVRAARDGTDLPLLHGLPMTHKDTHLTRGIRTTMGSPLLRDNVPARSEIIVERLQRAGVVSTGKNNVPEFAAGSHTFNEVFGVTRNPHDLALSAGGSSGGAAVSLATGIQTLADGSDMGGSLRNPASFNGVVGMRPSAGVVPMGPNPNPRAWLSVTGPMARTVDDIILMLAAVAGPHPDVPLPCPVGDVGALLTEPVRDDLDGLRVGWSTDLGLDVPVDPGPASAVEGMAQLLTSLGAAVEQDCPDLRGADRVFEVHRALDMALSLRDLVRDHRHDGTVKVEVLWNVDRGLQLTGADVVDATVARARLDAKVARWFGRFDVLVVPVSQVLPFPVEERWPRTLAGQEMRTYVEWMRSCSLISATGCPAISVPAGAVPAISVPAGAVPANSVPAGSVPVGADAATGLPVGVQLVAAPGRDLDLLRVARVVDRYQNVIPRLRTAT